MEEKNGSISRRSILRAAAGTAATIGAVGALPSTAAADVGGRRIPQDRIAIQLYTLRDLLQNDPAGTLEALADIGYRNVELAGTYGRSAQEFRGLLDRYRLRAVSAHVGFDNSDVDQLISDAKVLGYRYADTAGANFGTIPEWKAYASRLDTAAAAFRRAGISYGYHNHSHEFEPLNGIRPIDVIAENTAPRNVHLEFDLYWVIVTGTNPVSEFYRRFGRVTQFHVKDRGPDGGFADVGTGNIDFVRIFRDTWPGNVRHYIVEHDATNDPLRTAEVSLKYLQQVRF